MKSNSRDLQIGIEEVEGEYAMMMISGLGRLDVCKTNRQTKSLWLESEVDEWEYGNVE